MSSGFSNELFAMEKCRILQVEIVTSNKKYSGIQLLVNILRTRYIDQNIQILVRNKVDFIFIFWIYVKFFSQSCNLRIVLKCYAIPVSNIPSTTENKHL